MKQYIQIFILAFSLVSAFCANGSEKQNLPRFASIKASEANTRSGPGINYPTLFLYQYKHLPLEIIAEYEQWRQVRDINGDEGWIHSSILSGKRTIIIKSKSEELLYASDSLRARVVARLEPNLVCPLVKCVKSWCKIKCGDHTGWVDKASVWGVYDHEKW